MREKNVWVLITDGETARICSTRGGHTTPIPTPPPRSALGGQDDRAARAWQGGNRRSTFDRSAKRDYAGYLAQLLLEAGREGAYDGLIVIAAPEIMKELNLALAPETCARLIGGIVRDVAHFAAAEDIPSFELRH